ncbi:MAG: 50S ribosomal protein L23 [archaeon]
MILKPITTEKAVKLIELENTLIFTVERKSKKAEIKKQVEDAFKVKVKSVNTLVRGNKKNAYVTLDKKNPAIDIATKLGMI